MVVVRSSAAAASHLADFFPTPWSWHEIKKIHFFRYPHIIHHGKEKIVENMKINPLKAHMLWNYLFIFLEISIFRCD